jgi:CBS domain-containing protein
LKNPKFRAERDGNKAFAQFDISKVEAYSLMVKNNWDALVIVDQSGRYIGVLSKPRLMDSMFSELIGISTVE